jgi:hypothetical protein
MSVRIRSSDDDTDLEWIREQDWNRVTRPRFDETSMNEHESGNENTVIGEGLRDSYNLRPRKRINYKE